MRFAIIQVHFVYMAREMVVFKQHNGQVATDVDSYPT
jgi:hypothetical protein